MEKKNINEVIANLSVEQLAGMIDHTFLKPSFPESGASCPSTF